jgi:LysM repeat protein
LKVITGSGYYSVRRTAVQTIKTAVVVVLLLFVLYGGYIALNHKETRFPENIENLVDPDMLAADVAVLPDGGAPTPLQFANVPGATGSVESSPSLPNAANPSAVNPSALNPSASASNSGADAFAKFASGPSPNFGSPSKDTNRENLGGSGESIPPIPNALPPSAPPSLPEIPSLELPASPPAGLPENTPAPRTGPDSASLLPVGGASNGVAAMNEASVVALASASNAKEPGFGLSLPANRTSPSNLPPVPPLDLPSLHGDAKSIADATQPKLSEDQPATPRMPTSSSGKSFENAKRMAMEQAEAGKLKEALAMLSVFYNAQDLPQSQHEDLVDMLDALAREVIYSRRHLLDMPYVVAPGETLEQIAKTCNVPVDVLSRINGLDPIATPPAGMKLKVIPGPFRAEIDLNTSEMTLFLGELYAGRYPATFGAEPEPRPGVYQILDKQRNRNYYASNGMQISANDPKNPFGGYWLDLGQDLCIHGSPDVDTGSSQLGCISLSPLDAADVFGMLGRGSQVTIRR